ncbi:hypothetical protein Cfla_1892 [Cellulomonas flavigena DSM 20109]|uniref:Uncharacterized protein n=1 Tax=Cellulomonas flavigena (strain ATCC 482 / DSM 20109 / BCRC 11376 / JCM 18109 / NBRC 3775 / NCIMB 8073 / NRS 134) TaxID=446466 RepID=D5UEX9_CELFN|nr:hypothetical protein Cfla_1892 [Cellulomonas flavigena DSM 20109]
MSRTSGVVSHPLSSGGPRSRPVSTARIVHIACAAVSGAWVWFGVSDVLVVVVTSRLSPAATERFP